ncbi:MAG: hypothetical protein AB1468_01960 [Candidatus Micrarchaeota archaeon]
MKRKSEAREAGVAQTAGAGIPKPLMAPLMILVFIAILLLGYLFISNMLNTFGRGGARGTTSQTTQPQTDGMQPPQLDLLACLAKYGVQKNSVIFYYADWCSYSQEMIPWARALEAEGYGFEWVEMSDANKTMLADECLGSIIQFAEGVPQFACAASNSLHIGEFDSREDMRDFAQKCKNA